MKLSIKDDFQKGKHKRKYLVLKLKKRNYIYQWLQIIIILIVVYVMFIILDTPDLHLIGGQGVQKGEEGVAKNSLQFH
jgi:hypothetical protein